MSNIFGALKNAGGSTPELEQELAAEFAEASRTTGRPILATPRPVSPKPPARERSSEIAARQVKLRLSALAPVLPFDRQNQRAAEQYQIIRTKILHDARRPQLVLVSSATSGDGKTVTSINVAASLALRPDARILLIDGDLRQPSVSQKLGIANSPGLSDVLSGTVSFENALVRAPEMPNLYILPAGECITRAADLLDSECWRSFINDWRGRFSTLICDAPPIATVADYELLQLVSDGVILVARPGHTERRAWNKALSTVDSQKMLGVVLNCVEDWWLWKTPSYGYYAKPTSEERE